VWDADGRVVQEFHRPGSFFLGNVLAFVAHDMQIVASPDSYKSEDVAMSIYDIASGKVVHEVPWPYPDQPSRVNTPYILVVSPDQTLAAVIYGAVHDLPVVL